MSECLKFPLRSMWPDYALSKEQANCMESKGFRVSSYYGKQDPNSEDAPAGPYAGPSEVYDGQLMGFDLMGWEWWEKQKAKWGGHYNPKLQLSDVSPDFEKKVLEIANNSKRSDIEKLAESIKQQIGRSLLFAPGIKDQMEMLIKWSQGKEEIPGMNPSRAVKIMFIYFPAEVRNHIEKTYSGFWGKMNFMVDNALELIGISPQRIDHLKRGLNSDNSNAKIGFALGFAFVVGIYVARSKKK